MTALAPQRSTALATTFGKAHRLSVRQRKRWLEILTSLDARNVYVVYDEMGAPILNVEEQGSGFSSFMKRLFLQYMRPFTSKVEDLSTGGTHVLTLRRPFRFVFHRLEVMDANGTKLWGTSQTYDGRRVVQLNLIDRVDPTVVGLARPAGAPITARYRALKRFLEGITIDAP